MSTRHLAIVLLPPCSAFGVGSLAEPFLQANRLSGKPLYSLSFHSWDGQPVALGGGLSHPVSSDLRSLSAADALLVHCEGVLPFAEAGALCQTLSQLAGRIPLLGGVHCGAWWLASAGLLDGRHATLHWPEHTAFADRFGKVVVSQHVYELDSSRFTCAGGLATVDGALALVGRHHGGELVDAIAAVLCAERVRGSEERQRVPLLARVGERHPKLTEAVMLMEANIEEPLTTDEIARLTNQSRRQLARLFKQYLDDSPSRYYQQLRLERARHLLRNTGKSVVQIGLLCGFSSGPHFATVYRSHFGISPREERFPGDHDPADTF